VFFVFFFFGFLGEIFSLLGNFILFSENEKKTRIFFEIFNDFFHHFFEIKLIKLATSRLT
jgi:hypothetical protein